MPQSQPTPLSVTKDFPINWESPADERLCWTQELNHFACPVTPLDFELIAKMIYLGLNKATNSYDIPITSDVRHINSYIYETLVYGSLKEFITKRQSLEKKLQDKMANLTELWETEWLPEIREYVTNWETYNLTDANISALLEHLHETEKRLIRLWEIHGLLFLPLMLAISSFVEMYQDLFGKSNKF